MDRHGRIGSAENADLFRRAENHWTEGRPEDAIRTALMAYRLNPQNTEAKVVLASLVGEFPSRIAPEMKSDILVLLQDKDVAPEYISTAGWFLVASEPWWNAAPDDAQCEVLAARLDTDTLGLALLRETPVYSRDAERVLTRLRRWLLLSEKGAAFPHLVEALTAQALLNGGAWPFDEAERERFAREPAHMLQAYLPPRASAGAPRNNDFADPLTRAVAADYEQWPYPSWQRPMAMATTLTLPNEVRALDPGGPDCLPVRAKILVAGCGTGSEAAQVALKYPDATITAIDLSEASLAYAQRRWAALGLREIRFVRLDLHKVSELNERFDAIFSSGVLHHLPDPERGWAALAGVLRPGGVMRIMLYSRAAHRWIAEAKAQIRDLAAGPVNDDVLRTVRRRFLDRPNDPLAQQVIHFSPFATLGGTHDLLLHRQDDTFDVPRIARALERLRLRLLAFVLPNPNARARYDAMFAQDRMHRSVQAWAMFERYDPSVFISQYDFWCRSEAFWFTGGSR
jgi:SAM-dependent methyltransferase